jgi:NAD(P)-dependent dehydrogenase (short-subunit alcohol dehydrogenase family)
MAEFVVLVTGGNRGIGLECCRQLAARGARVLMGSRDAAKGEIARKSLGELAARVRVEQLAADDAASVAACAARLAKDPGRLDALINNAAIYDKGDAAASKLPLEVLQRTFATNVHGPLLIAQALLPLLRKSERGRIINLSSGMGQLSSAGPGSAAYRMSKTALNGLTTTLAAELAPERIAVNCVCPGWVKTDMGGAGATREVAQGADTPVWLALDAPQALTGKFLRDRAEIPW